MSPLFKRILTGASLIVLVALLVVWNRAHPNGIIVWGVALVLSALGAIELGRMPGLGVPRLTTALLVAVASVAALSLWLGATTGLVVWVLAGYVAGAVVGGERRGLAGGLAVWCAVPLFGLLTIYRDYGERGLVCLVVLSKVGDVFGYFVGRAIGKRHPFPRLSPGKTVAGCVASVVSGVAAGMILAATDSLPAVDVSLLAGGLVGLVLNLAAQAGDLLESRVKRLGGVKDSSALVGPAGGVLDVVDSLLLSVPAALGLWPLVLGIAS